MRQKKVRTPRVNRKYITVGELLRKVAECVLAEPKRANLNGFVFALDGMDSGGIRYDYTAPACGTVACLAGWGAVLLRPALTSTCFIGMMAGGVMAYLIGDSGSLLPRLFASLPQPCYGETSVGMPGTKKHANAIAKRIRMWLRANPEQAARIIDVEQARLALAGELQRCDYHKMFVAA